MSTEGFRRIVDASEQEQHEIRLLRAGGMLPRSPLRARPGSPASSSQQAGEGPLLAPSSTRWLVTTFPTLQQFFNFIVSVCTSRRLNGPCDGVCGAETRPYVSKDRVSESGIYVKSPMSKSVFLDSKIQSAPASATVTTLMSTVESGGAGVGERDSQEPKNGPSSSSTLNTVAAQRSSRPTPGGSGAGGSFCVVDTVARGSTDDVSMTASFSRPSHHAGAVKFHVSSSSGDSLVEAIETPVWSSTVSNIDNSDITSIDSLRGLSISPSVTCRSRRNFEEDISAYEESAGLDGTGDTCDLMNSRPLPQDEASPSPLRSDNLELDDAGVANPKTDVTLATVEHEPDQSKLSSDHGGEPPRTINTANSSQAVIQERSHVAGDNNAATLRRRGKV